MSDSPAAAEAITELFEGDVVVTDEMVLSVLDRRIVPHLHFTGLEHVNRAVLRGEMAVIEASTTVKELFKATERARYRWTSIGVFNDIRATFEPIADGAPEDLCVHFHVDEKRPSKQLGVFTTDTSVPEITASINNLLSSRYTVSGRYIPPASRTHAFSLSAVSNVPWFGRTSEYYCGLRRDERPISLAEAEKVEEVKVVNSSVEPGTTSLWAAGFQRRSAASRDMFELPGSYRALLGETLKAFVSHQWHASSEEHHQHPFLFSLYPLPIRGGSVFVHNEASVDPRTGVPVLRSEAQWVWHCLLGPFFSVTWRGRVGVGAAWGGPLPLSDRLHLGWRHVRGHKSIGPSTEDYRPLEEAESAEDRGCVARYASTGGNSLWSSSLSLNFPIPFVPHNGLLAGHLFADAGNNGYYASVGEWAAGLARSVTGASCSVGAGLVVTQIPFFGVLPSGRFELNCAYPCRYDARKGVFVGGAGRGLFDRWRFGLIWSSNVTD